MYSREKRSEEVFQLAHEAKQYVHSRIKKSSSQISANQLEDVYFQSLDEGVDDILQLNLKEAKLKKDSNPLVTDKTLLYYESVIAVTSKYSLGNCYEMAIQALDYVLYHGAPDIRAEIFELKGGNHVFLVLNRNLNSKPDQPATWGPNAVICDPWAEKDGIFRAIDYHSKLKNFYFKQNKNYVENFDTDKHTLAPIEYFDTTHLRAVRSLDLLKERFSIAWKNLLKELKNIKIVLASYPEKDDFSSVNDTNITELMKSIDLKIELAEKDLALFLKTNFMDYRSAEIELSQELNKLAQKVEDIKDIFIKVKLELAWNKPQSSLLSEKGMFSDTREDKTFSDSNLKKSANDPKIQIDALNKSGKR